MVHQVALVGCAHIHTPGFIKRLNERPDIRVKAVWDHQAERAALRAKELNAPVVADLSEIYFCIIADIKAAAKTFYACIATDKRII